jgi:hypothetical protein
MTEGPDYASADSLTPGRIISALLVLIWIVAAWRIGGSQLGVRAALFFVFPLAFIWIPEWMSRVAGVADRKSLAADVPMLPGILKAVGWLVIVGVPVSWMIFAQALKTP